MTSPGSTILATAVSHQWRNLTNQDTSLASAADLSWLGFSYIAFRLLHTLRERQTGKLPALSLREYTSYVLFFPAGGTYSLAARDRFGGPPRIGELYGRYDDGTVEPSAIHVKNGEMLEKVDIAVHKIW